MTVITAPAVCRRGKVLWTGLMPDYNRRKVASYFLGRSVIFSHIIFELVSMITAVWHFIDDSNSSCNSDRFWELLRHDNMKRYSRDLQLKILRALPTRGIIMNTCCNWCHRRDLEKWNHIRKVTICFYVYTKPVICIKPYIIQIFTKKHS